MDRIDIPLNELRLSGFARCLGERFRVRIDSDVVEMVLIEANGVAVGRNQPSREPFSLLFRGPATPRLSQGTFVFEHESIGTFAIFIVPIGPDEQGPRYEAIFN